MSPRAILAATAYFGLVFAAGFALGAARELFLRPWLGPDWSRVVEMPVMVAIAWAAAGLVVGWFGARLAGRKSRTLPALSREWLTVGLLAFALLLVAEFLTGYLVLKIGPIAWLASLLTWVGLLGLLAQTSLIVFPALQARRLGA